MSRESGINSDLWGRHLSVRDSSATALQRKLSPPHRLGNGVCSHVASNLQENPPEVSSSVAESSWSFPYREVQMVLGNSAKKKKNPLERTNTNEIKPDADWTGRGWLPLFVVVLSRL